MTYRVFKSEEELYGSKKTNHRCHSGILYKKLFETAGSDDASSIICPLLASGAAKMKKLLTYAEKQLPGGEYWEPNTAIKAILKELKPSNDFCESILGLNDYLTSALPNLTQSARSNLIQVKKNHTMQWLEELPDDTQLRVMDLAVKEKPKVAQERKRQEELRSQQRRQAMLQANARREAFKRKAQQEKDELLQHHLITTSSELDSMLGRIDTEKISAQQKKAKKIQLLKTQIRIRKKILGQDIRIFFSHARKQRPLCKIVKELSDHICNNTSNSEYVQNPSLLVGQNIQHRFETEHSTKVWYDAIVLRYDSTTKMHEIKYEGEEEHCNFDLVLDFLNGDLKIL